MSRITLNNYEAFLLDYLEGNISSDDAAELMLFAAQHPELEIDLEDGLIELTDFTIATLTDADKESLKELAELEVLVVEQMDEELSSSGRLDQLKTKYPQKYLDVVADYEKTKLVADSLHLELKAELKQPLVINIYWRVAVAAAIIGFIVTFLPWNSFNEGNMATQEETAIDRETSAPLKAIHPINLVHHKTFNFDNKDKEQVNSNLSNDKLVADEITNTIDSLKDVEEFQENMEFNIALDTSNQEPRLEDEIVIENDSIVVPTIIEEVNKQEVADISSPKSLTVPEFLAEKVLKVEKQEEEPLLASILDQKTNWDVDYNETESNEKKITQFKVGKFEFYKSSKK